MSFHLKRSRKLVPSDPQSNAPISELLPIETEKQKNFCLLKQKNRALQNVIILQVKKVLYHNHGCDHKVSETIYINHTSLFIIPQKHIHSRPVPVFVSHETKC